MPSRTAVFSISIALVVIVAFRFASPQAVSIVPQQRSVSNRVGALLKVENLSFKDLNRNGVLDPYEDWRRPVGTRVADLLSRMTLEEKAGLMQITSFNADALNDYINQRHIRYLILRDNLGARELAERAPKSRARSGARRESRSSMAIKWTSRPNRGGTAFRRPSARAQS
jgi:hypothetical protein